MDKDEIWSKTLALLLENTDEEDPKTVFLNLLTPVGVFGDQFVLLAESTPVESWVRKNYLGEMQEKLLQVTGTPISIGLGVNTQKDAPQQQATNTQVTATQEPMQQTEPDWMNQFVDPSSISNQAPSSTMPAAEEAGRVGGEYASSPTSGEEALFSKCTFDTFVVGKSNEFARGAALAVAEQPGIAYNPLFIYGNSGLGKTHLLVAIANYAMQNFPRMATRYVSANKFLNDYVEATQRNQWGTFNSKYHQVDILLVDDVQYLEGKDETINQLFNIFNEMTNRNKQIVLSADRAPKDIDMDDRMRSRFISGLLADIKPPDYETRLAILKNYLSRVNQHTSFYGNIPDDVLGYLAEVATSNIREMEGAITRLVSNMTLLKKNSISIEEAQELLQDFFPTIQDKQIDIALIQSEVERFFKISHEDMISGKRSKGITTPRHIAIYLSRYMTEESLESIGKKFGGRDHTTVMHSVNKIERDQKDNRILFDQLEQLTLIIQERC
ncbi:MAG TPA: chromosomal replication initiator protein DnaA [Coriobacteriaceae bacterium]|nr:chromosomal replication initiator protein DnaA [Coriobacteriaceae bacterium]